MVTILLCLIANFFYSINYLEKYTTSPYKGLQISSHKMYIKNSWLAENARVIKIKKMDRIQKVRSVPHGQIYRPVFDAEEQLIKSIKLHKNPLPVLESPEGATIRAVFDQLRNDYAIAIIFNKIMKAKKWFRWYFRQRNSIIRSIWIWKWSFRLRSQEFTWPASTDWSVKNASFKTRKDLCPSRSQTFKAEVAKCSVFCRFFCFRHLCRFDHRCSMTLKRIVKDFASEMKFGLEDLQTKVKDLSFALKTRLDLNREDVLQAGYLNTSA